MKKEIHPKYFENVKISCSSCGATFVAGSVIQELKTEICSACHPFYTGKRRIVDTEGRADKFLKKLEKAKNMKSKKAEKDEIKKNKEKESEDIEKEIEQVVAKNEPVKEKAKKVVKAKKAKKA